MMHAKKKAENHRCVQNYQHSAWHRAGVQKNISLVLLLILFSLTSYTNNLFCFRPLQSSYSHTFFDS